MSTDLAQLETLFNTHLGEGRLQKHVLLAPYTTFKIGGPADLFIEIYSATELEKVIRLVRQLGLPYFILGMGANILIGDRGFRGLVIRNRAQKIQVDPALKQVHAESGSIVYPDLIETCVSHGLSGLEHYVGIPSTVGGAMWQNLHFLSPDRSRTVFIEEVVHRARILTPENQVQVVDKEYFSFGYDYSILHEKADIVLEVTFQLKPESIEKMRQTMKANLAWRRERHPPLDIEPSAGSIFKKIQGIGAGRLIDQCGLKGFRIGDAEVSHRHANIIINRGHATAADVRALIEHIQKVVFEKTNYWLEPEIGFVGEF